MICMECGKAEVVQVALPIYADKFERDGTSYHVLVTHISGFQCPICLETRPDAESDERICEVYRTLSRGTLA